jgi:hypothetical protein
MFFYPFRARRLAFEHPCPEGNGPRLSVPTIRAWNDRTRCTAWWDADTVVAVEHDMGVIVGSDG